MKNTIYNVCSFAHDTVSILDNNKTEHLNRLFFKSLRLSDSEIFLPICLVSNFYNKIPILLNNNNYEIYCIRDIKPNNYSYTTLTNIKKYLSYNVIKSIKIENTEYLIGEGCIFLKKSLLPIFMIGVSFKIIKDTINSTISIYIKDIDSPLLKNLKKSINRIDHIGSLGMNTRECFTDLPNLNSRVNILQSEYYNSLFEELFTSKFPDVSNINFKIGNVLRSLNLLDL